MNFDNTPEDMESCYDCKLCNGGTISEDPRSANTWSCDSCDFSSDISDPDDKE
jgi:hypothetical protein